VTKAARFGPFVSDAGVTFRLWAPAARTVSLLLGDDAKPVLDPRVANDVTKTLLPIAAWSNDPLANGRISAAKTGTQGIPGDIWQPEVFKIADLPSIPISVNLSPKGSQIIEIKPVLPERFGGYAFIVDLGSRGRRFATSCVRTFAASAEKIQFPKMSLDEPAGIDVLRRLGIKAVRLECAYTPTTDPQFAEKMSRLQAHLKELADSNITVLLTLGAGVNLQEEPLGRGRPHLSEDNLMLKTKEDLAWPPKFDSDFQKFVATLCRDNGWPKGPVTAVQLWNEPWEGISISGWGADMQRYRAMFTAMAQGVEEARKAYRLAAPVALGFSNGANIAAAMLLLRPGTHAGAALLRPMAPFAQPPRAELAGKPVLILSGATDPIVSAADAGRLGDILEAAGAEVQLERLPTGHALSQADVAIAKAWLGKDWLGKAFAV